MKTSSLGTLRIDGSVSHEQTLYPILLVIIKSQMDNNWMDGWMDGWMSFKVD